MRNSFAPKGGVEYIEKDGAYVPIITVTTDATRDAFPVAMCAYCTGEARHVMRAEVGGRILNSLCDNHAETFKARGSIID